MTQYDVDGVKTPQDEGTGVSEAAAGWNSAAYIGNLAMLGLGDGWARYVGDITVDSNDYLKIGPSQFVVIDDSTVTGQDPDGAYNMPVESGMAYLVSFSEADTFWEMNDGANEVYIKVNPGQDDGVHIADTQPTDPAVGFKFATVNYDFINQTIDSIEYHNDQSNVAADSGEFADLSFDQGTRTTEPSDPSDVVRLQDTLSDVVGSGQNQFNPDVETVNAMPTGVKNAATARDQGEEYAIIVGGRNNDGNVENTAQSADVSGSGVSWTVQEPYPLQRVDASAEFVTSGNLWVMGGYDSNGNVTTDTRGATTPTITGWYSGDPLNTARAEATATRSVTDIVLAGGFDSNGNRLASVEFGSPNGGMDPNALPDMNAARANHAALNINDEVWVFGGADGASPTVEKIDPTASNPTWEAVGDYSYFQYRRGFDVTRIGNIILVVGGWNTLVTEYETDLEYYDYTIQQAPATRTLSQIEAEDHWVLNPYGDGTNMLVGGGETASFTATDTTYEIEPRFVDTLATAGDNGTVTINSSDERAFIRNKTKGIEVSQTEQPLIVEEGDEVGYASEDSDALVMLNL